MPKVIGVSLSPFVRKVRVALAEKGIDYELESVIPFALPDDFHEISPIRKIPVFQDGDFVLPDSSVIIAYLERTHPKPPLYPSDPKQYGRALFLEEYADTKLTEATLPFFQQRVVFAKYMNRPVDEAALDAAREASKDSFAYLESQLDAGEAIVGSDFSVADIAIATQFANMLHGGESVDAKTYPKLAGYVATVHARPSFKALIEEERAGLPG